MENGIKVEGGDKLGKTIIFAKNAKHASFIVEQFDLNYPHLNGQFCRKIDYSVKYVSSLIDEFKIKNKNPFIVASVDMLDTGIDVPEIVNLVFFKLVRSKTKFWQMIGRGTRLCEDLFEPGKDKQEFIVFDYCQNLDFFDAKPEGYDSGVQDSLKQKIFKRRLELIASISEAKDEDESLQSLVNTLKNQLHFGVQSMNLDNFIIRKQRKVVEYFISRVRWNNLSSEDLKLLEEKVSSLPYPDHDEEYARRFDLLILNLQIAIAQGGNAVGEYIRDVRKLIKHLEEKEAIPSVAANMDLILAIQTDEWWNDITLTRLEELRCALRNLTKFIDKESAFNDVFTNFEDQIQEGEIDFELIKKDPKLEEYRKKVQRFINEHRNHITIRRLQNNEPVSLTDIKALEEILFAENGPIPRETYDLIFSEKPLGVLVRSVVGLSRKAAKEAFAEFLSRAPMHPDQISFLDEVVEYLVKNGTMEPKIMFDTPFTNIHDQGLAGIFDSDSSKKVIELIRHINKNAELTNVI
jgi:type I restriction enzyme R subunit